MVARLLPASRRGGFSRRAPAEQARSVFSLEVAERQYQIARRGANEAGQATQFRVAEGLGDVAGQSFLLPRAVGFDLGPQVQTQNLGCVGVTTQRPCDLTVQSVGMLT